ncbi:uncharacterized protein LOC144446564 [Glandiceps talaboti]
MSKDGPGHNVALRGDNNTVIITGSLAEISIGESAKQRKQPSTSGACQTANEEELEDAAVEICQETLKELYRDKMSWVEPVPWCDAGFQIQLADVYTQLELIERSRRGVVSVGANFRDSLSSPRPPHRILVEGEAGMGKSTFCRKISLDWALGSEPVLQKYKLLFALELRQITTSGMLLDCIFDQLLTDDLGINRQHLENYIKNNQENILILLDGADELKDSLKDDVFRLIRSKVLPKATIVVTTRPIGRPDLIKFVDQHYIIKGFSQESIAVYVHKFFQYDASKAESLIEKIRNEETIENLAMNPLLAVLLCVLWEDNSNYLPNRLCDLNNQLVWCIFKRYCAKHNISLQSQKHFPQKYKEYFMKLGEMAYEGLKEMKVRFDVDDLLKYDIPKELLNMGFLNQEYSGARIQNVKFWVFLHKSFQEFIAAYYLHESGQSGDEATIRQLIENKDLHMVCLYICGLLKKLGTVVFEVFYDILKQTTTYDIQHFSFLVELAIACLNESDASDIGVKYIASAVIRKNALNIYRPHCTPQFMRGLTMLLNHYSEMGDIDDKVKLTSLQLIYTVSAYYVAHDEFFNALAKCKHLQRLRLLIYDSFAGHLMNMLKKNRAVNYLGLVVVHRLSVRSAISSFYDEIADISNIEYLTLSLYDKTQYDNIDKFHKEQGETIQNGFKISDNLRCLSLFGSYRTEVLFVEVADQIIQSHLRSFSTIFTSNGMLTERRNCLANILAKNKTITKLIFNSEVCHDGGDQPSFTTQTSHGLQSKKVIYAQVSTTESNMASNEFHNAVRQSNHLKYVCIMHWGSDQDLEAFFKCLSKNLSIEFLVMFVGSWPIEIATTVLRMIGENRSLKVFAIISENEVLVHEANLVPSTYRSCEIGTVVPNTEEPLLLAPGFSNWDQWEGWFRDITTFESQSKSPSEKEVENFAKSQLLFKVLPPLKELGYHIKAWCCNHEQQP